PISVGKSALPPWYPENAPSRFWRCDPRAAASSSQASSSLKPGLRRTRRTGRRSTPTAPGAGAAGALNPLLPDAEDVLGLFAGHLPRVPGRGPDQVHLHVASAREARRDAIDLALQHRPDGAAGAGQGHRDLDVVVLHLDTVDQAQVA